MGNNWIKVVNIYVSNNPMDRMWLCFRMSRVMDEEPSINGGNFNMVLQERDNFSSMLVRLSLEE